MSREKGITRHASGSCFMHVVIPKPLHTFGRQASYDDDWRADFHPAVEVLDMLVDHAEAPVRRIGADRLGHVRTMDSHMGVGPALEEVHRAGSERIVGAAGHAVLVLAVFFRLARLHILGGYPARPLLLVADPGSALKLKSFPANGDRIAARGRGRFDQIEAARAGIDDNRARTVARERD